MWTNRPKVSWSAGQGQENIWDKPMTGWPLLLNILYATALSMLSLYAACLMGDMLGLPMEKRWTAGLGAAAVWCLVIVAWNEVMHALGKKMLRRRRETVLWVMRLLGNIVLFIVLFWGNGAVWWTNFDGSNAQARREGFDGIELRYMERWNEYFAVSNPLPDAVGVTRSQQQWAWIAFAVVFVMFLQLVSGFLRKRTIMLLAPTVALAAGMLVGLTPRWPGMACMFAAGMLSLYMDRHRDFRPVPALLLAGLLALSLPLTAAVMEGPALRVNQSHDRLQTFQHDVERGIREYDWEALFGAGQEGTVDNRQPEYEHKEMMTVTVNDVPDANIYLRGYCGAGYQSGRWDSAERAFDRACREQGLDSGEASLLLARLCAPAGGGGIEYELRYRGIKGRQAYLPYGADPETLGEQCRIRGDYVVEKEGGLDKLTFSGYAPGVLASNGRESWDGDARQFYSWYNAYVLEQYLAVSEDFPELTNIVNNIVASDDYRAVRERMQSKLTGENESRLALSSLVAGRLKSLARYNIDPGPLPRGADPVEYFLGENRQGYCAHFASAGALLLRRLGVPARYVTGYVVQPGQFRRSRYGYRATVRDDTAHAWVEIWLDDVGWVPVEMTPSYEETGTVLAGQDVPERQEDMQPESDENEVQEPEPSPVPTAEPPENETDGGLQTAKPEKEAGSFGDSGGTGVPGETGVPGGTPDSDTPEGWGFAGEGGWAVFGQNGSLRVSHVLLAVLGALAAAGMAVFAVPRLLRYREARWRKIQYDVESGGARRAVCTINRMLYRRLWRQRAGMLSIRSDQEYLAALKRGYPGEDWDSYLEVVRRAVYSREEISLEAARSCYDILKRVCASKASAQKTPEDNAHKTSEKETE